ncbi:MAG: serine/threonine-protein kinase [Candidatus Obscuribacterales bacterium]
MNHPLINTVLDGKYRIERLIGSGGMGSVYEATHILMNRRVAVKLLNRIDEASLRRFERECRVLSALSHDAIPKLLGWGVNAEGCPYLAMEIVDGRTLEDLLAEQKTIEPELLRTISIAVCDALQAMHNVGIVHRDIKPSNILVDTTGDAPSIKVTDLGIAGSMSGEIKATMTDAIVGSIDYMSPEHYRPADLEARSDLFSLGCVMYRALAGHAPFVGDSIVEVAMQLQENRKEKLPASVPEYLKSIIEKCLAPEPVERFVSAADLRQALIDRKVVYVAPPHSRPRTASRGKMLAIGSVISLGLVLGVIALISFNQSKFTDDPSTSDDRIQQLSREIPSYLSTADENGWIQAQHWDTETKLSLMRYRLKLSELEHDKSRAIEQHMHLAQFLRKQLRLNESRDEIEFALHELRQQPEFERKYMMQARLTIELGQTLYSLNKYKEAAAAFKQAAQVLNDKAEDSPEWGTARTSLGMCQMEIGQADKAVKSFSDADKVFQQKGMWMFETQCLEGLLAAKIKLDDGENLDALRQRLQEAKLRHGSPGVFEKCSAEIRQGRMETTNLATLSRTVDAFENIKPLKDDQLSVLAVMSQHAGDLYRTIKSPDMARKYYRKALVFILSIHDIKTRFKSLTILLAHVEEFDKQLFGQCCAIACTTVQSNSENQSIEQTELCALAHSIRAATDHKFVDVGAYGALLIPILKRRSELATNVNEKVSFGTSCVELLSLSGKHKDAIRFAEALRSDAQGKPVKPIFEIALLANLSREYENTDDFAAAEKTLKTAYALSQRAPDLAKIPRAVTVRQLADFYIRRGNMQEATPLLEQSRNLILSDLDKTTANKLLLNSQVEYADWSSIPLATAYRDSHQKEKALSVCREQVQLWHDAGTESIHSPEMKKQLRLAESM